MNMTGPIKALAAMFTIEDARKELAEQAAQKKASDADLQIRKKFTKLLRDAGVSYYNASKFKINLNKSDSELVRRIVYCNGMRLGTIEDIISFDEFIKDEIRWRNHTTIRRVQVEYFADVIESCVVKI